MSYFNEVYNDPELSARAKQVLVYLHDRANKDGEGAVKIYAQNCLQAPAE